MRLRRDSIDRECDARGHWVHGHNWVDRRDWVDRLDRFDWVDRSGRPEPVGKR
jgi:hypothetical protein